MPSSLPAPYRAAQRKARAAAGSLTQASARRVVAAIEAYADELTDQLAALPVATAGTRRLAIEQSIAITRRAAATLRDRLQDAVSSNRRVAFADVYRTWQDASAALAKLENVPGALLGAVQTPKVLMAGAFEALGGVSYLKTLTASAKAGSDEVAALIRTGITANLSPKELAKRLRPYMAGAEAFESVFPKRDERFAALYRLRDTKLSPELRNAAFRVRSNSLRIAYSEIHNARAEAELQAFAVDPLISAVRWELSPFRGSQGSPDVCDGLAHNDWYGLGAGIYPLDAVPLPPHPRDRCERVPVPRPPDQWHLPKPRGLKRVLRPGKATIPVRAGMSTLTQADAARVRKQLRTVLSATDSSAVRAGMQSLMDEGEAQAAKLVAERATMQKPLPPKPLTVRDRPPGWTGPTGQALRDRFTALVEKEARVTDRLAGEIKATIAEFEALPAEAKVPGHPVADRLDARIERIYDRRDRIRGAAQRSAARLLRSDTVNASTIEWPEKFQKSTRTHYEAGVQRWRELWGSRVPPDAVFRMRSRVGAYAHSQGFPSARAYWWEPARAAFLRPGDDLGTIVHELTHGAEYSVQAIHERALAFRAARSVGEVPVRLKSIYPDWTFRKDEMTLQDRFDELLGPPWAYAGKLYPGDRATEILTVGVELLVRDPIDFAARDPEYFDFIIETLWGAL